MMPNILIIGGSSGIGLASAQKFLQAKYAVTVASSHATKRDLPGLHVIDLDFIDEMAVKAFFERYVEFDYIVVTATTPLVLGSFLSLDSKIAQKSFDKLWGMRHVIYYAAQYSKHLKAITLVSGAAADKRGINMTYLAMLCSANNVLVESLAVELAPLRINAVSPGLTQTPLYGDMSRDTLQEWADGSPLKRLATADEIADVIYFVTLHPQMTGAIVPVDGGARLV